VKVGWKTWASFALVLGAGVGVFAFLPRWVSKRPIQEVPDVPLVQEVPDGNPIPEAPSAANESPQIGEAPGETEETSPPPVELSSVEPSVEVAPPPADPTPDAFGAAMSEALEALKREDYALAREAFERAKAIRNESPEAASGLSQAEEGLRNRAIAGHRDRAVEQEALENWRGAEAEYDSALALDPSLRFAQEGKKRTAARAHLQERLDFQIAHPERLSDRRALEEASRLVDEARGVEPSGRRQREAITRLEAIVLSFSQPVEVSILSDNLTDVALLRIGRLGKFDRRVLSLRPGRYVVVGSRPGFRDVRIEIVVEPGKSLAPVLVRCEEAI
jgi:hypothetical protein